MPEFISVVELAQAFGITPRAIRFYEDKGLLSPQRVGATRIYSHRDRARLKLILRGKRLGFSLADIAEYLSLYDADTHHLEQCRVLLRKIQSRVAELEQQRDDITVTLDELAEIRDQALANLRERGEAG